MSKNAKQNWIVKTRCTVIKKVFVEDCTEEQARNDPFEYASYEEEIDLCDFTVQSVISE